MNNLLQCPFCGGDAELITRGNDATKKRSAEVECLSCHTKQITGAIRNDLDWCKAIAIGKWNKRTETQKPVSEEGVKELIVELAELKKFHINPYNLGDMGKVGEIIDKLQKQTTYNQ